MARHCPDSGERSDLFLNPAKPRHFSMFCCLAKARKFPSFCFCCRCCVCGCEDKQTQQLKPSRHFCISLPAHLTINCSSELSLKFWATKSPNEIKSTPQESTHGYSGQVALLGGRMQCCRRGCGISLSLFLGTRDMVHSAI